MFERHKALRYPANTRQYLWRYFPVDRLVDLLNTEELFFTHLPTFSDGLEGRLTSKSREHLTEWFRLHNKCSEEAAQKEVRCYEDAQNAFYASCWHMNDYESYLMWKVYAERGLAVRTTFERVQAAFDRANIALTGGMIDYVDFTRESTAVGNVFHLVMTKDQPYKDEREFRLLFWKLDPRNAEQRILPKGVRVPVDVRMLIDRVYINPLRQEVPGELLAALERNNIEIDTSALKLRT